MTPKRLDEIEAAARDLAGLEECGATFIRARTVLELCAALREAWAAEERRPAAAEGK